MLEPRTERRDPNGRSGRIRRLIARRLLWVPVLLLFVSTVTFSLMHLAPGSPWDPQLGESGTGMVLPQSTIDQLNAHYGLNDPLAQQFGRYLVNAAHFDFGESYHYTGQQVSAVVAERWPRTLVFGAICLALIFPVGVGLGLAAALRKGSALDHGVAAFGAMAASLPNFVIGLFLVLVFSVQLNRLTAGRFYLPASGFGLDRHLILPVASLAMLPVAFVARLTRTSALHTLDEAHVRTARSKGLAERAVVMRHVVRNSLVPVVSTLGPLTAHMITGTVVIETLFGMRGLGATFVDAVAARDYPIIMGLSLLYAVIIVLANLAVDVVYMLIDPQIQPT